MKLLTTNLWIMLSYLTMVSGEKKTNTLVLSFCSSFGSLSTTCDVHYIGEKAEISTTNQSKSEQHTHTV